MNKGPRPTLDSANGLHMIARLQGRQRCIDNVKSPAFLLHIEVCGITACMGNDTFKEYLGMLAGDGVTEFDDAADAEGA